MIFSFDQVVLSLFTLVLLGFVGFRIRGPEGLSIVLFSEGPPLPYHCVGRFVSTIAEPPLKTRLADLPSTSPMRLTGRKSLVFCDQDSQPIFRITAD